MGDKIKKLSEAIRLGATFRPQGFGLIFSDGKSCAYGAAIEAIGWREKYEIACAQGTDEVHAFWKEFDSRFGVATTPLFIADKNDSGQTREQIADWLESQGL